MRDQDSQLRAQQPLEQRHARTPQGKSCSCDLDGPGADLQLARGTHEIDRARLAAACDDVPPDIAAVPRPILVFDDSALIVDVNPGAETLLGYTRRALIGEPLELVASNLASTERVMGVRFVPSSAGAAVHHRNGRVSAVEALLCRHGARSTAAILHAVESTIDGLRQDDVAQIVHDFKNPLSMIALETSVLDERIARGDPSNVRDALARISRNVEFLDRMVHNLLDLCSLDAARLELDRKPAELRGLLARIIDRVVPPRERDRVSFHATEPVTLSIDDLRIERVVANLLENALKYAPKSSSIVVRLAVAIDSVRVSVTDTGPGLTAGEIGNVFDKFRRASAADTHEGSGLGLYVTKRIVEAHGGRIDVTSVHGAGSQFFFDLPRHAATRRSTAI